MTEKKRDLGTRSQERDGNISETFAFVFHLSIFNMMKLLDKTFTIKLLAQMYLKKYTYLFV